MNINVDFKRFLSHLLLIGSLMLTQYAVADSAFSWGPWAGGEEMARMLTSSPQSFRNELRIGTNCLHPSCASEYNKYESNRIEKYIAEKAPVVCEKGDIGEGCLPGPRVTQQ